MRTAKEMDTYALTKGYFYGEEAGRSMAGRGTALRHFEAIENVLHPSEKVLFTMVLNSVFKTGYDSTGGTTAVAFTNKRLIYGQRTLLMSKDRVYITNLELISSVNKEVGMLSGTIEIKTVDARIEFKIPKFKLDKIYNDILRIIEKYHSPNNKKDIKEESVFDEIKKYKELLDMGIITHEEFDKKKKQLLNL